MAAPLAALVLTSAKIGGYVLGVKSLANTADKLRKAYSLRTNIINQSKFGHGTGTPYAMYK